MNDLFAEFQAAERERLRALGHGEANVAYARADWSEEDEAVIRAVISADQSYLLDAIRRCGPADPFDSAEAGRQAFDDFISDLRGFLKRNTQ